MRLNSAKFPTHTLVCGVNVTEVPDAPAHRMIRIVHEGKIIKLIERDQLILTTALIEGRRRC